GLVAVAHGRVDVPVADVERHGDDMLCLGVVEGPGAESDLRDGVTVVEGDWRWRHAQEPKPNNHPTMAPPTISGTGWTLKRTVAMRLRTAISHNGQAALMVFTSPAPLSATAPTVVPRALGAKSHATSNSKATTTGRMPSMPACSHG